MPFEIPDACSLPTAEQPLRLAEFDALFTTAVREVTAVSPTHIRLRLSGPPGLEATVRDLAARETQCCSFFAFNVFSDGDALILDIEVPAAHADVLAALAGRASAVSSGPTP
jgi:hypothetical protein